MFTLSGIGGICNNHQYSLKSYGNKVCRHAKKLNEAPPVSLNESVDTGSVLDKILIIRLDYVKRIRGYRWGRQIVNSDDRLRHGKKKHITQKLNPPLKQKLE